MRAYKRRRGEGYLEACVSVIVLVMAVVVILNLFGLLSVKVELDRVADTLLEAATESGAFGNEYESMKAELQGSMDFTASYDAEAYYNSAYHLVQLGDRMQVTVTTEASFSLGSIEIPVTVSVTKHGLSEKYWK